MIVGPFIVPNQVDCVDPGSIYHRALSSPINDWNMTIKIGQENITIPLIVHVLLCIVKDVSSVQTK